MLLSQLTLSQYCFEAALTNESIHIWHVVDDIQLSDPQSKDGKNDEENPDAMPDNTCRTFLSSNSHGSDKLCFAS